MDVVSLVLGLAALGYGVYMFFVRRNAPQKIMKLQAMQRAFGERPGYIVHLIGYTVIPILFGVFALVSGINGRSVLF